MTIVTDGYRGATRTMICDNYHKYGVLGLGFVINLCMFRFGNGSKKMSTWMYRMSLSNSYIQSID
jgi:hypothetical protein